MYIITIINICIYHYLRDLLFQTKSWNVSVLYFMFKFFRIINQKLHLENSSPNWLISTFFYSFFSSIDNLYIISINTDMLLPHVRNNINCQIKM